VKIHINKKNKPNRGAIDSYHELLLSEEMSCKELIDDELRNIAHYNKQYNAFITFPLSEHSGDPERKAAHFDGRLRNYRKKSGRKRRMPPLFAVPFTIKDNIFVAGTRTTAGCGAFLDFIPRSNASCIDSILINEGILLGKTNLHELALGATSSSSYFGPVRNPRDSTRISGGSSGGSAVSVALSESGLVASLGTDTGGSVRIPAALCGVFGFKPSLGRIGTDGVFPLSATLDHVGILASSIQDLIRVYESLAPVEKKDNRKRKAVRIGIPKNFFVEDMDRDVSSAFWKTVEALSSSSHDLGIEIIESVDCSFCSRAGYPRRKIQLGEAAWFYKELLTDGAKRRMLQSDVRRLLDSGAKVGMVGLMQGYLRRVDFIFEFERAFKEFDYLLTPTCPIVAPKLQEIMGRETGPVRGLLIRNTEPFNLTGFPALSFPAGERVLRGNSFPVGIQIIGKYGDDSGVLRIGQMIQTA
jgi:aspartyl-tRNA(Asn)/glutamyl-tRNA(Gln) amidotransferase subunit A